MVAFVVPVDVVVFFWRRKCRPRGRSAKLRLARTRDTKADKLCGGKRKYHVAVARQPARKNGAIAVKFPVFLHCLGRQVGATRPVKKSCFIWS